MRKEALLINLISAITVVCLSIMLIKGNTYDRYKTRLFTTHEHYETKYKWEIDQFLDYASMAVSYQEESDTFKYYDSLANYHKKLSTDYEDSSDRYWELYKYK